ncbi:MAG: hypothetical protein JSV44_03390 [Candidatus Zixiibacteriota bacterium]|nr:MAG: hypothetical protein JSV44_03390 [candidate division Zixibacteria bacterium]
MKSFVIVCLVMALGMDVMAQGVPDSVHERQGMENLMGLLNLKLSDLTFRDDYTEIDDFRLTTVSNLMKNPYGMIAFTEQLRDRCRNGNLASILGFAFEHLKKTNQEKRSRASYQLDHDLDRGANLYYNTLEFNRLLSRADHFLERILSPSQQATLADLSRIQQDFLFAEFKEMILEDTADESKPVDVLDSIQKAEEKYIKDFVEFGNRIHKDHIIDAGIQSSIAMYEEIVQLTNEIASGRISVGRILSDTAALPERTGIASYLGKKEGWIIGGPGNDHYQGEYRFIIEFGGDDRYDLAYNPAEPHGSIIIDLGGNDVYNSMTEFTIGSGCNSVGLLYDITGDDVYNGGSFSCGSGFFGFGLLYDGGGNDKYYGDTHCLGAATFGVGVIIDRGGSDLYSAAFLSQGCGLVEGFGLVVDHDGSDNYIAGNKYTEMLGLSGGNPHYLSLSQGFGYGFRPYTSGGIGAVVDFKGNDTYISDIYGQGSSYWWSLGAVYDSSGHDQYVSYQYAQGAGIHMSLGILFDHRGDDFYRGKGLMQGCGHDYGCGLMLDRSGDDIFHAVGLSQGGGQANGFGIFINDYGADAYYVIDTHNTQGYGNPRRDFGSIGLFLDLSGFDRYDGNGADNQYWKTPSKWGGGMDWEFILPDSLSQAGVD